jgi:phosphate-selective porin OprO/OprP
MPRPHCRWQYVAPSAAIIALSGALDARADESELRTRIEQQERRILELERKLDALSARESNARTPSLPESVQRAKDVATPQAHAGDFIVASADGVSTLRPRGLVHFDGRYFADDVAPASADAWVLRRARPTFEASLAGLGEVRLTPEFGGGRSSILDASISVRLRPPFTITAGKFKVPVGLERLMSASDLRFIERGFPTSLVPNRDLGLQVGGDIARGVFNYSLGYFNGVTDGASSENNAPTPDAENDTSGDWAARVFVRPFAHRESSGLHGLGFGVGATFVDASGSAEVSLLPTFRTPGQQTFFRYREGTFADGERVRWAPQFYYYRGPFGVLGEYTHVAQDVARTSAAGMRFASLDTHAWQIQLAWMLTGETEAFKGSVTPSRPFALDDGGWGAFELVARYHEVDIDDDAFAQDADAFADLGSSASRASAWGVGVNWHLNEHYTWSLNYDRTRFDGGAVDGASRSDEEALLTRFGVDF